MVKEWGRVLTGVLLSVVLLAACAVPTAPVDRCAHLPVVGLVRDSLGNVVDTIHATLRICDGKLTPWGAP